MKINCAVCGKEVEKRSSQQKYCVECSKTKDLERKRKYANKHKPSLEEIKRKHEIRDQHMRERGLEISESSTQNIDWVANNNLI